MDGLQLDAFQDERSPERAAISPDVVPGDQFCQAATHATSAPIGETAEPDDDFRWWFRPENEATIVVGEQLAISVYRNRGNGIVVRQQSTGDPNEDGFVVLRDPEAAKSLIAALQREIGVRAR